MRYLSIEVTRSDARNGCRFSTHRCAAAIAIARATGCRVRANQVAIALYRPPAQGADKWERLDVPTPRTIGSRMVRSDHDRPDRFQPYAFLLVVPDDWVLARTEYDANGQM